MPPYKHGTPSGGGGRCRILLCAGFLLVVGYGFFIVWLHTNGSQILHPQVPPSLTVATNARVASESAHVPKDHGSTTTEASQLLLERLKKTAPEGENAVEEGAVHVIFSTDCSFYQDWQTLLIFFTAVRVGQKGSITRIASGCEESKKATLTKLYKTLYPQYGVHFTPDFKKDPKTGKSYDFYNKPYGVQHWLRAHPEVTPGTVIAIIDPDMIFLRPLTTKVAGEPSNIFMRGFDETHEHVPAFVGKGRPAAQLYGLGAPWAVEHHRHFNRTEVCGPNSPCLKVVPRYGELHYSVGPPYLVERSDLERLTDTWCKMVPIVYARYPELLAEMYAYSMAAAHENLPHLTMQNYMVSNTEAQDEGWPWVDALGDQTCEAPVGNLFYPGKQLPTMLHYCQFFRVGEWGFQKRRVPKRMFECSCQLLGKIPQNIALTNYKNRDGEIIPINRRYARRNSFMLCGIHQSINDMLRDFKAKMCTGDKAAIINLNESLNLAKALHW